MKAQDFDSRKLLIILLLAGNLLALLTIAKDKLERHNQELQEFLSPMAPSVLWHAMDEAKKQCWAIYSPGRGTPEVECTAGVRARLTEPPTIPHCSGFDRSPCFKTTEEAEKVGNAYIDLVLDRYLKGPMSIIVFVVGIFLTYKAIRGVRAERVAEGKKQESVMSDIAGGFFVFPFIGLFAVMPWVWLLQFLSWLLGEVFGLVGWVDASVLVFVHLFVMHHEAKKLTKDGKEAWKDAEEKLHAGTGDAKPQK